MKCQGEILDTLSAFAERHQWSSARDRVQALAKIHVIDAVAAMLAGVGTDQVRLLTRSVFNDSRTNPRLVSIQETVKDPSKAAYAYALSGRVLDFDDVQTTQHSTFGLLANPSVPVLAAALAAGQARHARGEEVLNAYLLGVEITARLAEATQPVHLANRFAATATFGGIGALIAAARLLGLDHKAIRSAYSLWESLVAVDPYEDESPRKLAYRDANSVRLAVAAAWHAKNGASVEPSANGPLSFVSPVTAQSLSRRLGKPYRILEPGFAIRAYPSNPLSHPAIDAALAITNMYGIAANDIDRVDVGITRIMADRLMTQPLTHATQLGRNLPYAIALAVCKGAVEADDFRQMPTDSRVVDMMRRVGCTVHPDLDELGYERARARVSVRLRNGRTIGVKTEVAKGSPQKPFSEVELSHKFLQCALYTIGERPAESLLNRLWALESLEDVGTLFTVNASGAAVDADLAATKIDGLGAGTKVNDDPYHRRTDALQHHVVSEFPPANL